MENAGTHGIYRIDNMRKSTRLFLSVLCIALMLLSAGCSTDRDDNGKSAALPDELAESRDSAMTAAKDAALELEGSFADRIMTNLMPYYQDDTVMTTGEYTALLSILTQQRDSLGASRMYVLVPDESGNFRLTADTDSQPWLEDMGTSSVYDEAYSDGLVAAERSGWKKGSSYFWTAYAPLYNSEGDIYAILAADVSADALADHPEWDRTSDSWNKFE